MAVCPVWVIRNKERGTYLRGADLQIKVFSCKIAAEGYMSAKGLNTNFYEVVELRR